MSKALLNVRLNDRQEAKIIFSFAQNHGWTEDEGDLIEFLSAYYDDYEEYREFYLNCMA